MAEHQRSSAGGPVNIELGGESSPVNPKEQTLKVPRIIPILPVKDMNLFPRMVMPLLLNDERHLPLVDEVLSGDKMVGLVAFKGDISPDQVNSLEDLYEVGVAALVLKMAKSEDEGVRLVAQGITRIQILELTQTKPFIKALILAQPDQVDMDMETMALFSNLKGQLKKVLELSPHIPEELGTIAASLDEPGGLCDLAAGTLNLSPGERQRIVGAIDVKERLRRISDFMNREIQVLELGSKIQNQVKEGLDKSQREYYLRQHLKAIQKELGEDEEGGNPEIEELRRRLEEKVLPEMARKDAERELTRLARMHPSASEYHVITTYLDWILTLPWNESTEDQLNIKSARDILEADHYDLEKVKKRILEYLAVRELNPKMKGPILCLVGPPGVGKTSLGRSIARAMGRKFARISLGGVRDEAEIRGHRRTYVGAMPGRIIQSLRRAGSNNPVFMLDEVDKVGSDFRGDPSSALLEVLDPEQNATFSDHYLDLEFDLSRVMFVTTANVLDTIPPALRDRMEVLEIPGYTAEDKLKIAKRYLVPRQRSEHGLKSSQLAISDAAIKLLISSYTREAGLRNLEREIGALCRHAARDIVEGETKKVRLGPKEVGQILGPERITPETALRTSVAGVATGLAWTPSGGDILFIEASAMPGKGSLSLTGQLGDVMKESAQAAVSFVRANAEKLGVDPKFHTEKDLHIHVPAGAIPKDGPSAGVTMFTALVSLLTGRPVRSDLAMTGEITLRGMVLPVGGIKEKVLAAHRAGIKRLILPERNQRDLEEVPDNVKKALQVTFVSRMEQLPKLTLEPAGGAKNKKPAAKKTATKKAAAKKTTGSKAPARKNAGASPEAPSA